MSVSGGPALTKMRERVGKAPPKKNVSLRVAGVDPECQERRRGKHNTTQPVFFYLVKASSAPAPPSDGHFFGEGREGFKTQTYYGQCSCKHRPRSSCTPHRDIDISDVSLKTFLVLVHRRIFRPSHLHLLGGARVSRPHHCQPTRPRCSICRPSPEPPPRDGTAR